MEEVLGLLDTLYYLPVTVLFNLTILFQFSVPICSSQDIDLESQASSLDNFVPAFKLVDSTNGSNGFCLLGKDDSSNSKGHQMKVSACADTTT